MTQPCPGGCNAGYRATGHGQPRPGDPVWCPPDTARIRAQLPQLDDLAAELECQVTGFHEQARSPVRRGGAMPSPSEAADYLDEFRRWLTDWEDGYREHHNREHPERPWLTRPYRGVLVTVQHGTICWLTANLDGLLGAEFPGAADFGREVGERWRELVAKTRAGTGRRLGAVPCPNVGCGLRLLAWVDGYDGLICGACNRYVTGDEYRAEVAAAARQLEAAG